MTLRQDRRARWFFIAAILLGAILRLSGLGVRAYGNDETTTSLRVAGYTLADYEHLLDGRTHTVASLVPYQTIAAHSHLGDVVHSLASEDPQHPPLFYLLERAWIGLDNDGVVGHRRLAALIGILVIPAAAWFARELFASTAAGLIAAFVVAVSPFQIAYSQQAREYSLWMLLTALTSALLIRLVRRASLIDLGLYTLLMIAGAYTDLLFVTVIAAHALVAAILMRGRRLLVLGGALVVVVAAYLPWLRYALGAQSTVTNNVFLAQALSVKVFVGKWLFNIATLLFDGEYHLHVLAPLAALSGAILIAALYRFRTAPKAARTLVTALVAIPTIALLVPDLLHHQSRSTASRYLVPVWLGLEMTLIFALAELVKTRRKLALLLCGGIVALGVGSTLVSARAQTWWTDGSTAALVAQSDALKALPPQSCVLFIESPARWDFSVMELVNRLEPQSEFVLFPNVTAFLKRRVPGELLDPSPDQLIAIRRSGARLTQIPLPVNDPTVTSLWHLTFDGTTTKQ